VDKHLSYTGHEGILKREWRKVSQIFKINVNISEY
jgi:hypothetical protein